MISCMCVTRGRPEFLRRAVENFEKQTYPNKELVIVSENLGTLDRLPSYVVRRYLDASAGHIPVGLQRNECISLCSGEFVAVWDDDDFFSPDRLEYSRQMMLSSNSQAFAFQEETLSRPSGVFKSTRRIWENSFFTRRSLLLRNPYPEVQLHEDLHMVRMFRHRFGPHSIHMDNSYYKYVYVQQPSGTTSVNQEHRGTWDANSAVRLHPDEAHSILQHCGAVYG